MVIARALCLAAVLLMGVSAAADETLDYRHRAIYFIVADRFASSVLLGNI